MGELNLQCLLGLRCNEFSMIAADQNNTSGVFILKCDVEKIHKVTDKLVMGVIGNAGDTAQFTQYITTNLQLYQMKNMYHLSTEAVVHFTRRNLADSLRNTNPVLVNVLFAGHDETMGGQLYYMDFLASCLKVPFAAHGVGGMLSMGILDRYYKPTLTEQEAYLILKDCVKEIQQRLFIKLPSFQVSVVSKNGVKTLPAISV